MASRSLASFVTLSTNARMPTVGLGTWQSTPEQVQNAVKVAIQCGYRHIDTAWAYRNEKEIGIALKEMFDSGVVKREDMFITTKLHGQFHAKEDVIPMLKDSLKSLQLEYLDMFLMHSPVTVMKSDTSIFPVEDGKIMWTDIDHLETWKEMESGFEQGLTKAIGVSNFNSVQIQRILDNCSVKPHNLQVECNAYWPQFELDAFCKEHGIAFTAYAPIGSPGHAGFSIARYGKLGGEKETQKQEISKDEKVLMKEEVVTRIAGKYSKTPAQVLLRWLVQRQIVAIPKSVTAERIKQNFDIWDFELNETEMKEIRTLKYQRQFDQKMAMGHPQYPFTFDEDSRMKM